MEYKANDSSVSMSTLRYNIQLEAQIISKELVTEVSDNIFVPVLLSAIHNKANNNATFTPKKRLKGLML
jgi:hypothetical protein